MSGSPGQCAALSQCPNLGDYPALDRPGGTWHRILRQAGALGIVLSIFAVSPSCANVDAYFGRSWPFTASITAASAGRNLLPTRITTFALASVTPVSCGTIIPVNAGSGPGPGESPALANSALTNDALGPPITTTFVMMLSGYCLPSPPARQCDFWKIAINCHARSMASGSPVIQMTNTDCGFLDSSETISAWRASSIRRQANWASSLSRSNRSASAFLFASAASAFAVSPAAFASAICLAVSNLYESNSIFEAASSCRCSVTTAPGGYANNRCRQSSERKRTNHQIFPRGER